MFRKIKLWWAFRRLSLARQALFQWETDSQKVLKQIQRKTRKLESLDRKLRSISESVLEDLADADKTIEQHAHALASIRSEYDVLKDVTLPTLVSENRAFRERWDAEIATARVRNVRMSEGNDSFN